MSKPDAGPWPPQPIKLSGGAGEATGDHGTIREHYVEALNWFEDINLKGDSGNNHPRPKRD